MSLDLDEETLAMLGFNSPQPGRAREGTDHYVSAPKPSRIPEGQVDGRHKARDREALSQAYWARRRAS